MSRHQVSDPNLKTVGLGWDRVLAGGFKSQSGFWRGSSRKYCQFHFGKDLKSLESLSSPFSGTNLLPTQPSPASGRTRSPQPGRGSLAWLSHLWSPEATHILFPTFLQPPPLYCTQANIQSALTAWFLLAFLNISFPVILSVFRIIFPRCFNWHLSSRNLVFLFSGSVYNLLRSIFIMYLSSLMFFKLLHLVIKMPPISSTRFESLFGHLCVDLASMPAWLFMPWISILKNKPLLLGRHQP